MTDVAELVVCSLEEWDDVWRRNQFFVDALLRRSEGLRVLFVEPPADPLHDLTMRRRPALPRLRRIGPRLRAFRPVKPLPRRFGEASDRALRSQVALAARIVGFRRPVLWLNDVTYAPLARRPGWPALYDVTDDWLVGPGSARERERLRRLEDVALELAAEVVVCSHDLVRTRGEQRPVTLVPNAVDVGHFRRPQPRPADLPPAPVAVYVGTLHDARLDVDLVLELVRAVPGLTVALIGPDSLSAQSRTRLAGQPAVYVLGPRPYAAVPGYLQHADAIVVPHRVDPFTESLDPIKAYECLAVDTPTVATPVAGFREHGEVVRLADTDEFAPTLARVLGQPNERHRQVPVPTWDERAAAFERVLARVVD